MKTFNTLTDEELVALTPRQVDDYVDLECAYAGVPFLPPAPVKPVGHKVEPDVTIYSVGDMHFIDMAHALEVMEMVNKLPRYTVTYLGNRYDKQIANEKEPVNVVPQRVFGADAGEQIKAHDKLHGEAQIIYGEAKAEYDSVSEKRFGIAEDVSLAVRVARSKESRRIELRSQLARYLHLAENDQTIAARFLLNAHQDAGDLLPELKPFMVVNSLQDKEKDVPF